VSGKLSCRTLVILGRFQQGFGRDATHIQAGPAQAGLALRVFPFIYANGIEAQLGAPYGCYIPAGAGAYDSYIKSR
jgi:hypothetical protein